MSTKIYTAYRLKDSKDLWPFVRDVRRKAVVHIQAALQALFDQLVDSVDKTSDAYKAMREIYTNDLLAREALTDQLLTKEYRNQAQASERNPFNFDVSIAIREHAGRLYLIPHCDWMMGHVLNFLKEDPRLEDFSYWNSSDQPDEVSETDWNLRRDIWDKIDKQQPDKSKKMYDSGWLDYVAIDICTPQNFYQIKPVLRHLKHRKGKTP